ncbi:HD-GYP domain-containing protein [Methylotenera sp. 1P/1]|uniref:HD-GYP domain-containing protein n=1 Tax=Methylotenera sp. 1P/1 TaxID=1131551 RepID=UPI00036192A8|nr:HD domain-containing phosphohydrolase [Methylotenera sp. 1P/1]
MTNHDDTSNNIIENIISASEDAEFYLSEDVFDQSGNKLLGKGYKITRKIKDKLISRVLKKPLETSITSIPSLTVDVLYTEANALIKDNPFLQNFNPEIQLDVYAIKELELAPLASLLLTVQRTNRMEAFQHTLFMTLIARLIAKKLNFDSSQIYDLTIACLLHDIGELYCVIPHTQNLSLEQWRSIMTHPIIGSTVVRQHMHYSANVSAAILEHHERNDGSGYPNHISAEEGTDIGKVMIVAEAFSGMARRDYNVRNLFTTLKLVCHDFPSAPYNALVDLLLSVADYENVKESNPILDQLLTQLKNIEEIIEQLKPLKAKNSEHFELSNYLIVRLKKICQIIYVSGLTDCIDLGLWEQIKLDKEINQELFITISEVEWKMKDVLRDISLRIVKDDIRVSDELLAIIQRMKGSDETVAIA